MDGFRWPHFGTPLTPEKMASAGWSWSQMDFSDPATRANSFQNIDGFRWPHFGTPLTPEKMASAGLFFCPDKKNLDAVKCYKCGGKLTGFDPTDDPKADHKTYYPQCSLSILESAEGTVALVDQAQNCSMNNLPEGWAVAKASNGKVYYWNRVTLETSWVKPSNTTEEHISQEPSGSQVSTMTLLKSCAKNEVPFILGFFELTILHSHA